MLQHLQKYRPDWELFLLAKRGKHSAGTGYCSRIWHDQEPAPDRKDFDRCFDLGWYENYNAYADVPSTKVTSCLRDVFKMDVDPALLRYKLNIRPEDFIEARRYLDSIGCTYGADGRANAVVIHYEGNTSTGKKNLGHGEAKIICGIAQDTGHIPIILDWDRRSPIPDQKRIFNPRVGKNDLWGSFGSGDALRIAALISLCRLFVGIDSGPQKCAGATDTPSIGVWTGHSPVQFMDLCPHFIHLVPDNWRTIPPCNVPHVADYFANHYRFETYESLPDKLDTVIGAALGGRKVQDGMVEVSGFWVPAYRPDQSRIIVDDIYFNDAYKTHLRPKKSGPEYVVDIGANVGCFSRLWHERNPEAKIAAVEVCQELLPSLRANVGSFATVIHAACTYEKNVQLLNTFTETGQSTGGSRVVVPEEYERETDAQYRHDGAVINTVTLEGIMAQCGFPRIDFLKLDCEGSEFSILRNCDLSKVGTIFVESHGAAKWRKLLSEKFVGWDIGHMSRSPDGEFENWHLVNPDFVNSKCV